MRGRSSSSSRYNPSHPSVFTRSPTSSHHIFSPSHFLRFFPHGGCLSSDNLTSLFLSELLPCFLDFLIWFSLSFFFYFCKIWTYQQLKEFKPFRLFFLIHLMSNTINYETQNYIMFYLSSFILQFHIFSYSDIPFYLEFFFCLQSRDSSRVKESSL